MPTRRRITRKTRKSCRGGALIRRGGRRTRGGSVFSWIAKKAFPWIKKSKFASNSLKFLGNTGIVPGAKAWGDAAASLGFGLNGRGGMKRRGRKKVYRRRRSRR